MKKLASKIKNKYGFSLIELALALVVVSSMSVVAITKYTTERQGALQKQTFFDLRQVKVALENYVAANGIYPCPSDPSLPEDDLRFSVGQRDVASGGNCTISSGDGVEEVEFSDPDDNDKSRFESPVDYISLGAVFNDDDILIGGIPCKDIGLPANCMFDPNGNRYAYAVIRELTRINACARYAMTSNMSPTPDYEELQRLGIMDSFNTSDSVITNFGTFATEDVTDGRADFALVYFGPDGYGAYNNSGSTKVEPTLISGADPELPSSYIGDNPYQEVNHGLHTGHDEYFLAPEASLGTGINFGDVVLFGRSTAMENIYCVSCNDLCDAHLADDRVVTKSGYTECTVGGGMFTADPLTCGCIDDTDCDVAGGYECGGDNKCILAGCSSNAECTPPGGCHSGTCDNICTLNSECLSNNCTSGTCIEDGSLLNGTACDANIDCVSDNCTGLVCISDGSVANGGACDAAEDCLSGTCTSNLCVGKALGAACAANGECASGTCTSGFCTSTNVANSGYCNANGQCLSGTCTSNACDGIDNGAACTSNAQCDSGNCTNSICIANSSIANGGTCDAAIDCVSGTCTSNVCVGSNVANGAWCNDNGQCLSGTCTSNACVGRANGVACTVNGQCVSATCTSGFCVGSGVANGGYCNDGSQCISGTCTTNACVGIANGGACTLDGQCASANCTNSLCIANSSVVNGGVCDAAIDCVSGTCTSNLCIGSNVANGGWCNAGAQCTSGTCTSNLCIGSSVANGGWCNDNAQCVSNSCVSNVCTGISNGAACSADGQCTSGNCTNSLCIADSSVANGEVCDAAIDCVSGTCTGGICKGANGAACSGDSGCTSGNCTNSVCIANSSIVNGGTCDAAIDCVSGTCTSNVCVGSGVANGGWCNAGAQCVSGTCTSNVCKGALGTSCSAGTDCQSGTCTSNFCTGTSEANGSYCNAANQCASGYCTGNVCTSCAGDDSLCGGAGYCCTSNVCGMCTINRRINFDGVNEVARKDSPSFATTTKTGGKAAAVWFELDSIPAPPSASSSWSLFQFGGANGTDIDATFGLGVRTHPTAFTGVRLANIAVAQGAASWHGFYDSTGELSTGTKYFAVMQTTGSAFQFYLNGSSRSVSSTGWLSSTNNVGNWFGNINAIVTRKFSVGSGWAAGTAGGTFFDGKIDEIMLFNDDLTAGQITTLYNGGTPLTPSGLSSADATVYGKVTNWWRMGEQEAGNITTIEDVIGSDDLTTTNMENADIEEVTYP